MSILNYECKADISNIEIIDKLLEITLNYHKINWYRQFCFAAHELLINSIEAMSKHSSSLDKIFIELAININSITFSIYDTGGGLPFDINDLPARYNISNMKSSGRGLFMIKSLVDDFSFFKADNGQYIYKISKNRAISNESEGPGK